MNQCSSNKTQLLLVGANGNYNTSGSMNINSLHYINKFYTIYWNIELKKHSLYYLTIIATGTNGTIKSDVALISKLLMYNSINKSNVFTRLDTYNVKNLIIERNQDIVCFYCDTILFNECQILIASSTETVTPQILYNNGTCYSFTDNGTYTVYVHDTEDGMTILTPAIVKEYTVDWIIPSSKS